MTNADKCIDLFLRQYPQYENIREHLSVNIFCDVLDLRQPEGMRVIAKSDCRHSLDRMSYDLPTKYEIV